MIDKFQSHVAHEIADELFDLGFIWGDELETYIKRGTEGLIDFDVQGEEFYLEFENKVLDDIEKLVNKKVVVTDLINNIVTTANSKFELRRTMGIDYNILVRCMKTNEIYRNRYRFGKYKIKY